MKPFKILCLAALVALMGMALAGASSAMAENTALCEEDVATCPSGKLVTHVHELIEKTKYLFGFIPLMTCHTLRLSTVTTQHTTKAVTSGNFTYSGCETSSGTECEVKETSPSSSVEIEKLGHELADVTYSFEVNVHCGSLLNCNYNGVGLTGHALGPLLAEGSENGEVRLEEQSLNKTGGSLCPKTAKLTMLSSPLSKAYITE